VLNGRPGVRPATAAKVDRAIAALGFRRDLSASLLARARDLRVSFLLPDGGNEFMASLEAAVARRGREAVDERMEMDVAHFHALDPVALARRLDALDRRDCDCAVVVASEDAAVHDAVAAASRRGIVVMTLVSDLPGSARRQFIGIDNVAAGRTAASLMGRFLPAGGAVALVAGSLGLRDHRERYEGFTGLAAAEFPRLTCLGPFEGHEEQTETGTVIASLLAAHPHLAGIYNMGAGNAGLVAALRDSGRGEAVRVIAHELTPASREGLAEGLIDVVLDQNPDGEIRGAVAAARAFALGEGEDFTPEPIEIGIFLRDNMR
jgi:LacI family transcriptional regulator